MLALADCLTAAAVVSAMRSLLPRTSIVLLLAAATICLLQSALVEAIDYASCSGAVCAEGAVNGHCCPSGGSISSGGNDVYCSQQQDCSAGKPHIFHLGNTALVIADSLSR